MSNRMTYDEFVDWAIATLCDAVITGGFKEVKSVFRHIVMQVLWIEHKNWEGWNK